MQGLHEFDNVLIHLLPVDYYPGPILGTRHRHKKTFGIFALVYS